MQGSPGEFQRCDDRQLCIMQFPGEFVFLEYGLITPASRPIKFRDDRSAVLNTDLVNTVLVTVQRQKSSIAAKRQALECVENMLGLQVRVGEGGIVGGTSHDSGVLIFMLMNVISGNWLLAIMACLVAACSADEPAMDLGAYEAEVMQWRADRLAALKHPDGYLTLVGLFWLTEENSRIGSADDNDILLPGKAAPHVGRVNMTDEGVMLVTEPGVDVRHEGIPVRSILMSDDTTENPVLITHGSLAWMLVNRDGHYAIRVRDYEHPALEAFPPIDYFPIDPALRVTATLQRFDEPRILNVDTVIEGLGYRPESPGTVAFDIDGETYELEAYASGDSLFFVFGDSTTSRETYPAGRFLYAAVPGDDGKTVLDFNRAYNPPCAFNDFATCPVASPRNRIAARIDAGEKFDPNVHATPDSYH